MSKTVNFTFALVAFVSAGLSASMPALESHLFTHFFDEFSIAQDFARSASKGLAITYCVIGLIGTIILTQSKRNLSLRNIVLIGAIYIGSGIFAIYAIDFQGTSR